MDREERPTKYAEGAKREAKLLFAWFANQALSRGSRIS
jgi:hypothetical protein